MAVFYALSGGFGLVLGSKQNNSGSIVYIGLYMRSYIRMLGFCFWMERVSVSHRKEAKAHCMA